MAVFMSPCLWLLASMVILGWSDAAYIRCPPTPECVGEDCPSEETCPYGTYPDRCRRTACAKGPGEPCGIGMFEHNGKCGEGMYCRCGRCLGCSLRSIECYHKTCT